MKNFTEFLNESNAQPLDLTDLEKYGVEYGHDEYDILVGKDSMPNVIIPIMDNEEVIAVEGDILKISKTGRAQVILFKQKGDNEFDGVYYLNGNDGCFKPDYTANRPYTMAQEWDMEEEEAEEFSELMREYNIRM